MSSMVHWFVVSMAFLMLVLGTEARGAPEQEEQIVIVAGLPSALGHHAARVYQDQGYSLAPFGLTFEDDVPKYVFSSHSKKNKERSTEKVHLLDLNNIYETEHTLKKYLAEVPRQASVSLVDTIGDDAVQYLGEALQLPVVEFGTTTSKKEASSTTKEPFAIDLDAQDVNEQEQKAKKEDVREQQRQMMEAHRARERDRYEQQQQQQQQQQARKREQEQQMETRNHRGRPSPYWNHFFDGFLPSYHWQHPRSHQKRYNRNWMVPHGGDLLLDPILEDFFYGAHHHRSRRRPWTNPFEEFPFHGSFGGFPQQWLF